MKVYLDPGHGGTDPGATANGIEEKRVNLAVALLARDMLRARGVEVMMARVDDTTKSLAARTSEANTQGVDAYVSIHHNASDNPNARGVEVYHSIVGGEGKRLAELIHDQYQALIPELPSRGVRTRKNSDGRDYYHVIRATRMPAVIIEGGFLTNSQDAALIKTRNFQERQARAVSQAVLEWCGKDIGEGEGTRILGPPQASVAQAREWTRGRKAHQRFIDIAPAYWEIGHAIGIRPEVAYCQAAKETAFGRYGGAVKPEQNNWAGIKTATAAGDRPEDHETFPTPEDGVRAHFNHLAAYVGLEPIGQPHGRYYIVRGLSWAGSVRYVEELGGKWAPNPDYGHSIVRDYLTDLLATPAPAAQPEPVPAEEMVPMAEYKRVVDELDIAREKLARIKEIVA